MSVNAGFMYFEVVSRYKFGTILSSFYHDMSLGSNNDLKLSFAWY